MGETRAPDTEATDEFLEDLHGTCRINSTCTPSCRTTEDRRGGTEPDDSEY